MMSKLLTVFVSLIFVSGLNAQVTIMKVPFEPIQKEVVEEDKFSFPEIENFDGTYQFIVYKKKDFILSTETFKLIEESRKEDEDYILSLSKDLGVMILSKSKITSGQFSPFTTTHVIK